MKFMVDKVNISINDEWFNILLFVTSKVSYIGYDFVYDNVPYFFESEREYLNEELTDSL